MCRTQGAESDWPTLPGRADRTLGALPTRPPLPGISDPGIYLDFLGQTLDFAVYSHEPRHHSAIGSGINADARAWEWSCEQVCVDALNPDSRRRSLVGQLGVIFAE